MPEVRSKEIFDKAYDISFAIFRVAAIVNNTKLKAALEDSAVDLILELNDRAVDKLGSLIKLAVSVNEMKAINGEVLLRELDNIKGKIQSAISQSAIGNEEEVDLNESFADLARGEPAESDSAGSPQADSASLLRANSAINEIEEKSEKINGNIANRQSAILDFIRQLPNGSRMRDLMVKFPEVSERTLRNDLHDLTTGGLVERVGSQGPFASFRAVTRSEIIAL